MIVCGVVPLDISDAAKRLFALVDARYPEQKEFAAKLGITPSIVSEWRRGKSESFAKPKYIKAIAELLETTTEYILTGNESQPAPERIRWPLPVSAAPLDPEALDVAAAYQQADARSRAIVRLALGLEITVVPMDPLQK